VYRIFRKIHFFNHLSGVGGRVEKKYVFQKNHDKTEMRKSGEGCEGKTGIFPKDTKKTHIQISIPCSTLAPSHTMKQTRVGLCRVFGTFGNFAQKIAKQLSMFRPGRVQILTRKRRVAEEC
jgi:hypothetical protein